MSDQINSTRIQLAAGGWPVSMDVYYPYGVEPNPPADANHYKFTGKERDVESGNDYFGARYYAGTMGRFMSPDWSDKPEAMPYAYLANPQSFNRAAQQKTACAPPPPDPKTQPPANRIPPNNMNGR